MNYLEFAKRELKLCGYDLEDKEEGPNKWMIENLLELLTVFDKQGHSGFSANYCIKTFAKLASLEPLSPLTGNDDEWNEIGEGMYQNKRCSHVFKEGKGGQAFDINGKIFRDKDGGCYTRKVFITFPYVPKSEYVDVDEDGEAK